MPTFFRRVLSACFLVVLSCLSQTVGGSEPALIPYPESVVLNEGTFCYSNSTSLFTNLCADDLEVALAPLRESGMPVGKLKRKVKGNALSLLLADSGYAPEAYFLEISGEGIRIEASDCTGIYYGVQTLVQLVEQYGSEALPCLSIKDSPYLKHRGVMIDVSRHFMSKEFIKRQIALMSRYKLNVLHWHLVDGAGWRIEIKSRPELTEQVAFRPCESIVEWDHTGWQYCTSDHVTAYGGYYTQDDIREVVAYAEKHHVTIIPEIEMPGHSEDVLCVYPELSCAGRPHANSDVCIGNPKTMEFIEDVLLEVMDLFPSEYIHIGGDEAGMAGWRTCDKCNALMEREGLKSYEELQSYLIRNVESFLASHGRKLIGWDEIMMGGLSPDATVMSWRSAEYGLKAAAMGHDAILCPIQYCYFNYYQDNPLIHPLSWSGYTSLEINYGFNPVPDSLSTEVKKHVIGLQGNLWTEYVKTEKNAETQLWPRCMSIAETAWTRPQLKDYGRFRTAALREVKYMQEEGYTPYDISKEYHDRPECSEQLEALSLGKPVKYLAWWSDDYPAGEEKALTDGIRGGWSYEDNRWQAFWSDGVDVVVDLGEATPVHEIKADFIQDYVGWFFFPKEVEICISADGENYEKLVTLRPPVGYSRIGYFLHTFGWEGTSEGRYVRYKATVDESNPRHGYLFTDEIIVR